MCLNCTLLFALIISVNRWNLIEYPLTFLVNILIFYLSNTLVSFFWSFDFFLPFVPIGFSYRRFSAFNILNFWLVHCLHCIVRDCHITFPYWLFFIFNKLLNNLSCLEALLAIVLLLYILLVFLILSITAQRNFISIA